MGGSSKSGGGSGVYNYFGTIAGALALGPVDEIYAIEVDDEIRWEGIVSRFNSPNPVPLDVPGYGRLRFHWGTDDQLSTDPVLVALKNTLGHQHPAYTGVCYAVLVDFLFGQGKTTAPNIRIYVRRAPQQNVVTGAAAHLTDGQANPVAIIAELLTSTRAGLGWTLDRIDVPSFQRAADTAQERNTLANVSLLLNKQTPAKAVITDLLDMIDGWVRPNRITGKLEIGIFTRPDQIDVPNLPLITEDGLISRPRLKPETWDDIATRWRCTYSDRLKNFKERSVKYDDARARYAAGTKRPQTLRRSHITRHAQALSHLQETAHRSGSPGNSGTLNVRAALYTNLLPGDHIRADIDPEPGGDRLNQVFRVLEIARREARDEMQLRVEAERTLAPVPEFPSTDPHGPPAPPPAVPDIARARFFEVPAGLADNQNYRVGILASRPSDTHGVCPASMVTGYRVYYDNTPGDLFPRIGGTRSFALYGRLVGALLATPSDTLTLTVEVTAQPGEEIISENPGETAARDDTLLAILIATDTAGRIKADNEQRAWIEILSCIDFTATGENLLKITALRARQGTPARTFSTGEEIWFIRRDQLTLIEHADFEKLAADNAPAYFKLQPLEPGRERPVEDCSPREFTFALARDLPDLPDGRYLERRFRRMSLKPDAPTGDVPTNWSLADPGGSGVLWYTEAYKREHTGKLLSPWSTPARVEGTRMFLQDAMPDPLTEDLRKGDLWWDTDDDNKLYEWTGTKWTPRFAPMLKFADGVVYGLQKADGSQSAFVLVAERFQIWDGTSAFCPFEIIDGRVFIKDAVIGKISAGKIASGDIEAQQIRLVGRDANIGSENYSAGETGWIIRGDGTAEFNKITVRDSIVVGTLGSVSIAPPYKDFKEGTSVGITISAPANSTVRYTTDSNSVTPASPEWPKSGSVYGTLTITKMTWLKVRAFGVDGRLSSEVMGLYIPTGTTMESCALPGFSVNAATLTISCATSGATIKYRSKATNGGAWSIWNTYLFPLAFSESTEVEAYATKSGMVDSAVTQTTVVPKCSTPSFSTPQRYNGTGYFYVTISCATSGATIYYRETTSSTAGAPWGAWKVYYSGSNITNSLSSSTGYYKPVQAYAAKSGLGDSDIASASIPPG